MDIDFWYFSYADADDGPYLRKFCGDLETELRNWSGLPPEPIEFTDRGRIALAETWDAVLEKRLKTCLVFVPLYSRSYFQSVYCGKEFAVFRQRLHTYQRFQMVVPVEKLILPVLWDPEHEIFNSIVGPIRKIPYIDEAYPGEYVCDGVLKMVKLGTSPGSKYYTAYRKFVGRFAMKIIDAAQRFMLPHLDIPLPPLANVQSVFEIASPPIPSSSASQARFLQLLEDRARFKGDIPSNLDHTKVSAESSHISKPTEPTGSTKQKQLLIFISYRREDTADITGRIYDNLVKHFGLTAIFKDVDSIPLGANFKQYLEKQVEKCSVLLAVIGKSWLRKKAGKRRVDDANDFVRIEIASALRRDISVIPLMVSNARMPAGADLPEDLRDLVFRNFIQIRSDPDFHNDMDRLIRELERPLGSD